MLGLNAQTPPNNPFKHLKAKVGDARQLKSPHRDIGFLKSVARFYTSGTLGNDALSLEQSALIFRVTFPQINYQSVKPSFIKVCITVPYVYSTRSPSQKGVRSLANSEGNPRKAVGN